nr:dTMP kinase [Nesterenkonia sp. NBAIMH1]
MPPTSSAPARPGLFLAFEGGEGAGKSTQVGLLREWLSAAGRDVIVTREPGGTDIGERVRTILLEHGQGEVDPRTEALLFAASRAAHVVQKIRPAIEAGQVVVSDRFVDSSLAYQGAGRELGVEAVADLNDWATEGMVPDLTVLLDVAPAISKARREARDLGAPGDRIESAEETFHARLRDAFLGRAAQAPERYLVLDGTLPAPEVHARIREALEPMLNV